MRLPSKEETSFIIVDDQGNLRFTPAGIHEYQALFARAGIDIDSIRTLNAYYEARKVAAPFLNDWLLESIPDDPNNEDAQLMRSLISDDVQVYSQKKRRILLRRTIRPAK